MSIERRPLRLLDFAFGLLGVAVGGSGVWLLLSWWEESLLVDAVGFQAAGVKMLMYPAKIVLSPIAGAIGLAFGCAFANRWNAQAKIASEDKNE